MINSVRSEGGVVYPMMANFDQTFTSILFSKKISELFF